MYEYSDGSPADGVKGGENVTGRLHIEPVDCISFADHNESLKSRMKQKVQNERTDQTVTKQESVFYGKCNDTDVYFALTVLSYCNSKIITTGWCDEAGFCFITPKLIHFQ